MTRRSRARLARAFIVALSIVSGLLWRPAELPAHAALRDAVPAAGSRLPLPPRELRLTFTEAVAVGFSRVQLIGPGGAAFALGPLTHPADSATVLVAPVAGALPPGDYTVAWEVAGSDGHPTRGSFAFTVDPPPPAIASAGDTSLRDSIVPPSAHHDPRVFPEGASFGVGSPAFVLVRWLTFVGLLGVIGSIAYGELVLPRALLREPGLAAMPGKDAWEGAARIGLGFAALLGIAAVLRLVAQLSALGASGSGRVGPLLFGTTWGWGWILQLLATLAVVVALLRPRASGRLVGVVAVVALAVSAALSGHAAAVPHLAAVSVIADSLHVLGAGVWLGTLLLLLLSGLPSIRRLPAASSADALAALVNAFSRVALGAAAVVVATGLFAAWLHLGSPGLLWQSAYGRTLLGKIAALAFVFAIGAYNQSRIRPTIRADGERAAGRLQTSATTELAFGALVLLVTAVLVATSPPGPQ